MAGGHGGKRKGAGQRKAAQPLTTFHIQLTVEQARLVRKWGRGNLSGGLRWLIDQAAKVVKKRGELEDPHSSE